MAVTRAVQTLDSTADADAVAAVLAEDGCVVVDRLVAPDTMDRIHEELAPHLDATGAGPDEFSGFNTRRTGCLLARSRSFHPIAAHPLVLGTLDRVLGVHSTNYQLHLTQVIDIGPDEPAQLVHRDQWAFDFFPFPQGYEVECHTMWAMSDFTEENGATRVITGSHQWEDKLRPGHEQTVPAEMAKGSVFVYVGSVYHGGGANRSAEHRLGINVGYTLAWLRQEENQYLACPPDVARELPVELAKLAGYSRGAYALGYFGDLQDPIEAVHGRAAGQVGFAAAP
ncbi:MAG TPA: phytanoyl-CoA dioxygenase family protein [Acidimicrobiales bacterium]|jgi:ectoine hydroxylase-related dioxygenase (phytanoyl-CoA dioxygenase family)